MIINSVGSSYQVTAALMKKTACHYSLWLKLLGLSTYSWRHKGLTFHLQA